MTGRGERAGTPGPQADIEELLCGSGGADDPLTRVLARWRAELSEPRPSAALAAVLAGGPIPLEVAGTAPPRRVPPVVVALSVTGALVIGAGVAAARDVLPGPVQRVVADAVNRWTPFHLDGRRSTPVPSGADSGTGSSPTPTPTPARHRVSPRRGASGGRGSVAAGRVPGAVVPGSGVGVSPSSVPGGSSSVLAPSGSARSASAARTRGATRTTIVTSGAGKSTAGKSTAAKRTAPESETPRAVGTSAASPRTKAPRSAAAESAAPKTENRKPATPKAVRSAAAGSAQRADAPGADPPTTGAPPLIREPETTRGPTALTLPSLPIS